RPLRSLGARGAFSRVHRGRRLAGLGAARRMMASRRIYSRLALITSVLLIAGAADRSEVAFPRDHGAHADAGIEWWYYTGHLRDAAKKEYGFELTFFRVRELSLAHFAWTDVSGRKFRYEEKAHRILPGIADAEAGRLSVSNETWSAKESGGAHQLHASGRDWELTLSLAPAGPPVIHGEGGISRKGPADADYSHYVSIPRLGASGTVRNGSVTEKLSGKAGVDGEGGPGGVAGEGCRRASRAGTGSGSSSTGAAS